MSKIITIFIVIILISGCATVFTRFEKYKEQIQNTILVKISCTITSAKNIVRQVIKESNLFVERPQLEKDNFIFANTGYGNYWKSVSINLIGIPQATYTRLCFFFDYN